MFGLDIKDMALKLITDEMVQDQVKSVVAWGKQKEQQLGGKITVNLEIVGDDICARVYCRNQYGKAELVETHYSRDFGAAHLKNLIK